MCLIIAFVFSYLSYSFYIDGEILNSIINATIAVIFIILLVRNIIKSRKYLKNKENKK